MTTKKCSKCAVMKPVAAFHKRSEGDGQRLKSHCIECVKQARLSYLQRPEVKERNRAQCREFEQSERGKEWRYSYNKTPARTIQLQAAAENQRDRGMWAAKGAVRAAINSGALKKRGKCSVCKRKIRTYMHHTHGYSAEHHLTVIEVCASCHRLEHLRMDNA